MFKLFTRVSGIIVSASLLSGLLLSSANAETTPQRYNYQTNAEAIMEIISRINALLQAQDNSLTANERKTLSDIVLKNSNKEKGGIPNEFKDVADLTDLFALKSDLAKPPSDRANKNRKKAGTVEEFQKFLEFETGFLSGFIKKLGGVKSDNAQTQEMIDAIKNLINNKIKVSTDLLNDIKNELKKKGYKSGDQLSSVSSDGNGLALASFDKKGNVQCTKFSARARTTAQAISVLPSSINLKPGQMLMFADMCEKIKRAIKQIGSKLVCVPPKPKPKPKVGLGDVLPPDMPLISPQDNTIIAPPIDGSGMSYPKR